jgi:hypothetical protein
MYCVDDKSFDDNFHRTVDDYLSVGLGTIRAKVESIIETVSVSGLGGQMQQMEQVGDQTISWEYVPWARFGWEPGNSWQHCAWIYFRHRMTNHQIKKRFGRQISASKDETDSSDPTSWMAKTFDIYEVWDKDARKVLFIALGEDEPLEMVDDPLGLIQFFPVPPPMTTNLPSEEMIPIPDYDYIEQYDVELNRLQQRRMALMEQLKAVGAYDSGLPELGDIMEMEDGQFKPIQNLGQRSKQSNGFENVLHYTPIEEKARVLQIITEQIIFVKAQVDEILGISDIVRGVTAASETLGAQEIKGRWVGVRLTRKRDMVQYTVREMFRIMTQLFGSHIITENLARMTQMEITPEMESLLQDDVLMTYIVDVEVDSTVAKDEFKERETRQGMLMGMAQYAQAVMPVVQQGALPADVSSAILRASLQPYAKYDRGLEEALGSLPNNQQQLQQLTGQLQQTGQELEQTKAQLQQWMALAQRLQNESTQAKSMQQIADAGKKKAETAEIYSDLGGQPRDVLDDAEQIADIQLKGAQTYKTRRDADKPSSAGGNGTNSAY